MPTNHDETLAERYMRELQTELAIYSRMTPEQIGAMAVDLHNALAERDAALAELAALKGGREAVGGDLSACPIAYAVKGSDVMFGTAYEAYQYMGEGSEPFALYTAPPAQASAWVQDSDIRSAAARAYGFLWHVNNEPGTPSPMYSAEKAAYRARIALRDMLTTEERGKAINAVGIEIGRYEQPAAPTPGASDGKGGEA